MKKLKKVVVTQQVPSTFPTRSNVFCLCVRKVGWKTSESRKEKKSRLFLIRNDRRFRGFEVELERGKSRTKIIGTLSGNGRGGRRRARQQWLSVKKNKLTTDQRYQKLRD